MEKETPSSVILHVDLDCFYAAVEQVRLGIPAEKPLAVQQWEGLIAVNYPARAAGIVRHDRVADALRKCPDLQLVHVETIGNDTWDGAAARRDTAKVSLERYRQASRCVFDIFHQHADICERASIDEAYLDVTKKVELFMKKSCNWDQELERLAGSQHLLGGSGEKAGMVVENGAVEICDPVSRRLLAGAIMAEQIRTDVKSKLGYTCSVGIATNKLLAKIASARNKPDRQTLILPGAVADLMDALPLKKVKLLGGKVGEEFSEKWCCKTAGDAQKIPLKSLLASFGDRLGNYVYRAVRGIHEDKVQEKQTTKSMLAAKSFQATNDLSIIRMWLGVLAEELSGRMLRDAAENHRQPHNLQLYYRSGLSRQSGDHSKSCSMPHAVIQLLASSCFRTLRASASRQQASEATGLSIKCDKECIDGGVAKFKDETKCDKLDPFEVFQCTEGEADREVSLFKEQSGFLAPEDKRLSTEECGRNVNYNDMVEDQTAKELSKLLQQASFQLFQRIEDAFPCTRLAIAASSFHDAPAQGSQSIQHFFGSAFQGSTAPSVKPPTEGLVDENKLVHKRTGLLRYMDNGIGLKKPCATSLNEVKGPCWVRDSMEESLCDENPRDSPSLGNDANQLLEDAKVVLAVEPALDVLDSGRCREELMDQQEVKPSDSPVSGKGSCRSLVVQCANQSLEVSSFGGCCEDPKDQQGIISGSKHFLHCSNQSLEVPGSGGCREELKDQQGVLSDIGCSINLKDIDVDEQCRILEEICKARSASQIGNMSSHKCVQSQETRAVKRRKPKSSDSKSGQLSLSKYFHCSG